MNQTDQSDQTDDQTILRDKDGNTLLHAAAFHNDLEDVKKYLHLKKERNKAGHTAMHIAAWNGYFQICELLIDTKNMKTKKGWNALHFASKGRYYDVCKLLADSDNVLYSIRKKLWTPLYLAAWNNDFEICKLIVDLNPKTVLEVTDYWWTPLHVAAACGHLDICKLLIETNGHWDQRDRKGRTALDLAELQKYNPRYTKVIEFLKENPKPIPWSNNIMVMTGNDSYFVRNRPELEQAKNSCIAYLQEPSPASQLEAEKFIKVTGGE